MIIIHPPNIEKSAIGLGRDDLNNDRFQPLIRHVVYKIAKDSNVNDVVPNVVAADDRLLKRLLESQADIIRTHNVGIILKSLWNFGWQRSHVCG